MWNVDVIHIDEEGFQQNVSQIHQEVLSTIEKDDDLIHLERDNVNAFTTYVSLIDKTLVEEDIEFDPDTDGKVLLL